MLALTDNGPPGFADANDKWVSEHSLETGMPLTPKYEAADGSHRVIDRVMSAETEDWNVRLRRAAQHLYLVGAERPFGYDLDQPDESWRGSIAVSSHSAMPETSLRDVFIAQQHVVLLEQPYKDATIIQLLAYSRRRSRDQDPKSGESGRLDYYVTLKDPAGIQPAWQACNGGFYYATDDGKVHMLLGKR